MLLDLIALGAIALAAWAGWRAGVLSTALSLGGLILGYLLAFALYRPVGDLIVAKTTATSLIAYPLAGIAIVIFTAIGVSMFRGFIRRRRRRRLATGWTPPVWDRAGGATISGVWAVFLVLLVTWVLVWLHSVNPKSPDVGSSITGKTAQALVGGVAFFVTSRATGDDALARTAAAMARDPQGGSESLGGLLGDPRVQTLLGDPALREQLAHGDPEAQARVRAVSADPRMLDLAHKAGLISDPKGMTPEQAHRELEQSLGELSETVTRLADDPEIRRLLENDRLREKIEAGDFPSLAQDADFSQLTERVWQQIRAQNPDAVRP